MKVAIIKCENYEPNTVETAIKKLFDVLNIKDFPTEIILKPNMLSARNPSEAVTTHPSIISELAKIIPGKKFLGDCPPGTKKPIEEYWKKCEYLPLDKNNNINLIQTEEESKIFTINVQNKEVAFPVSNSFLNHPVINIPKFKTHNLTGITIAMKNTYGFIPGYSKSILHSRFPDTEKFNTFIVEYYKTIEKNIFFNLVDAVEIMEGDGPANGEKRHYGYIIGGTNAVAVDTLCAKIAGLKIKEVPFLRIYNKKYGIPDFKIVGDNIEIIKNFKKSSSSFLFKMAAYKWISPVFTLLGKNFKITPVILPNKCQKCFQCYRICPQKTISKDLKIDRKKCINCLCCYEVCTSKAIELKKSWVAELFT
jgi:uncharacterized protein (DUF362 family)/NAD-dependent dihydropyrimidine dehydrogenase PreA subunit